MKHLRIFSFILFFILANSMVNAQNKPETKARVTVFDISATQAAQIRATTEAEQQAALLQKSKTIRSPYKKLSFIAFGLVGGIIPDLDDEKTLNGRFDSQSNTSFGFGGTIRYSIDTYIAIQSEFAVLLDSGGAHTWIYDTNGTTIEKSIKLKADGKTDYPTINPVLLFSLSNPTLSSEKMSASLCFGPGFTFSSKKAIVSFTEDVRSPIGSGYTDHINVVVKNPLSLDLTLGTDFAFRLANRTFVAHARIFRAVTPTELIIAEGEENKPYEGDSLMKFYRAGFRIGLGIQW